MKNLFFTFMFSVFLMANNASTCVFETQEDLNKAVATYAYEGYEKVNAHWTMPGAGTGLSTYGTESIHWKPTTGFLSLVVDYERNQGVLPSVALTDFLESHTVADCRISMYAVMTYVLMKIVGDDTFNTLISEHEKKHLFLISSASTPLLNFTELRNTKYLWEEKTVGLFGYIHNVAYYRIRHPHGTCPGENVVIMSLDESGDPLYLGFPFDNPFNKTAIRDRLKAAFKKEPLKSETKNTKARDAFRQKIYDKWMADLNEGLKKWTDFVVKNFDRLFEMRQEDTFFDYDQKQEALPLEFHEVLGEQGEKLVYQFKLEKLDSFLKSK